MDCKTVIVVDILGVICDSKGLIDYYCWWVFLVLCVAYLMGLIFLKTFISYH